MLPVPSKPHTPAPAFASWSGPKRPRVLFVGEAWGRDEDQVRRPFVGESGKELFRMLGEALPDIAPGLHARVADMTKYGLSWVKDREEWYEAAGFGFTNVLGFRPQDNSLQAVTMTKPELKASWPELVDAYGPLGKGRYLDPRYWGELTRLWEEIETARPNLVVPLGATALWALTGLTNISSVRGTIAPTSRGHKMLPTYHPAGVLRNWSWRPIVIADLGKAFREADSPTITRPARALKILPTLDECCRFLAALQASPPDLLASDTETASGQITTIGFAPSPDACFVIPFWDKSKPGWSYWDSAESEATAWRIVRQLIGWGVAPWPVVWQNGVYDIQYLWRHGIRPRADHDSMLLHHSIYPEMQKGLGFLGSVYTSEPAWKLMRRRRTAEVVKADE